jgi:hypothetical protein
MTRRRCTSCEAPVRWAVMPTGSKMPLSDAEVMVTQGVIALHGPSGRGYRLTEADIAGGKAQAWQDRGDVTFHVAHFADCPNAAAHRRRAA